MSLYLTPQLNAKMLALGYFSYAEFITPLLRCRTEVTEEEEGGGGAAG